MRHLRARIQLATSRAVDLEKEQRRAEHLAAALHNVGPEQGAGSVIWARAIRDLMPLLDSARGAFSEDRATRQDFERLHSTALLLLVSIDQIVRFEKRVRKLTGDAKLAKARHAFDAVGISSKALRDIAMHLDDYAVNEGNRQTGRAEPPLAETYPYTSVYWVAVEVKTTTQTTPGDGGFYVDIAGESLNLRTTAKAALDLAAAVEETRARWLVKTENRANAILRQRHPLAFDDSLAETDTK